MRAAPKMDSIAQLRQAITDQGRNPKHHTTVQARHRKEWPVFWAAIDRLLVELEPQATKYKELARIANTPRETDERIYDEDGYCYSCGNGSWKYHMPECLIADLLDYFTGNAVEIA